MQVLLYLIYIYTQGKDESEFHLGERGRGRGRKVLPSFEYSQIAQTISNNT